VGWGGAGVRAWAVGRRPEPADAEIQRLVDATMQVVGDEHEDGPLGA
jgi:hypothetical protein